MSSNRALNGTPDTELTAHRRVRQACRNELEGIFVTLKAEPVSELSPLNYEELAITVSELQLSPTSEEPEDRNRNPLFEPDFDENIIKDEYEAYGNITDTAITPWSLDPGEVWQGRDGTPHLTFTMINHSAPHQGLLRVELLMILGVMLTRHRIVSMKAHNIMPVSIQAGNMIEKIDVISCFNRYKARVLRAHMSETGLAIEKNRFYDFITPESRATNGPLSPRASWKSTHL
ncbi:hypothetical protein BJY01DRAFT_250557 [Aspergillus pseudoustus]|uniref:Uncharacterized protein n=1 Tax=Aspergillus pseudoustus TaxID=1810923 RepID=A0ABR4JH53_9EURO